MNKVIAVEELCLSDRWYWFIRPDLDSSLKRRELAEIVESCLWTARCQHFFGQVSQSEGFG